MTSLATDIERLDHPETAAQVAELLATAALDRNPVRVVGGGGARALGNLLRSVGWSMSTTRLDRVLAYQPTDMTLSVEAGARLADVSAVLAEHGQMLPIEAADPSLATIGGLLATGLAGPRRYGGGTLRDVLIGNSVAYADGTVAKAGGMVVKNVSGFDMMRVHYGAMGTLGVIVSANFKVLPRARSEFTAVANCQNMAEAVTAASNLREPGVRPVALLLRFDAESWELAARYEGRDSGLTSVRTRISGLMQPGIVNLQGSQSVAYWQGVMDARRMDQPDELRIRITVAPSAVLETATASLEVIEATHSVLRFEIEPGLGAMTYSIGSISDSASAPIHSMIEKLRAGFPSSVVTVLAAPDEIKAGLDVWGREPETLEIMRALKQEFDPMGILNPGCFAGSI